jgi:hypothetical protein
MKRKQIINCFWRDVAKQDEGALRAYFWEDAFIRWHCTNEHFNVNEYIIANCEYPGNWGGQVERIEEIGNLLISVTRVWLTDENISFHVTSFFEFNEDKIVELNEYWGDDGTPPQWRINKHIGKVINVES